MVSLSLLVYCGMYRVRKVRGYEKTDMYHLLTFSARLCDGRYKLGTITPLSHALVTKVMGATEKSAVHCLYSTQLGILFYIARTSSAH